MKNSLPLAIPAATGCAAGVILGPALFAAFTYVYGQILDLGQRPHSTVVLEWGDAHHHDGTAGLKQFYGAHIYTVKRYQGYDVYCQIHIGDPTYNHDCGYLGRVGDEKVARQRWGRVRWAEDAVVFGETDTHGFSVARADFQRHR